MSGGADLDTCVRAFKADPDGYESNRDLGLKMMATSALILPAEQHILKALSYGRDDADRDHLLHALATVLEYKGDFETPIGLLSELVNRNPDSVKYLPELGNALFRAGRISEASDVFRIMLGLCHQRARQDAANKHGPVIQLIFPSQILCNRFGELGEKLDIYVKARIFGHTPAVTAVLLAPPNLVVNKALLEYWKKAAAPYVTVISDESEIAEFQEAYGENLLFVDYFEIPDGRVVDRALAHPLFQRRWEDEGRAPLLRLSAEHREGGRAALGSLGMPEDAWFVSLHVRESGYRAEGVPWDYNAYRNSRIEDYVPAIRAITARGGWVVRIGDPSMTPLPPMERVIDYVHTEVRDDWMDLFCCSQCRFLIGTPSGPDSVAFAFGVPVANTNWFPPGFWSKSPRDLFVPKLLRRRESGCYLDIHEATRAPIAGLHTPAYFHDHGIDVIDNAPEDIADVAIEMMDRLDGTRTYSAEEERRQARFKSLAEIGGLPIVPRVGAAFLEKHAFLTERSSEPPG